MQQPWTFYLYLVLSGLREWIPLPSHGYLSPKQQRIWSHKRRVIRRVWLASMGVVLLHPALYMLLAVSLFATFLSFAIIDEFPGS
ncbi:hypothetical protein DU002_12325 [Corallincola holothuriorum]|uniref:Uncharacterized protein n=1 Tax=Corallincola holothuriorum TaxID=2282215 RepID=A0A368NF82_9GAMM|nr:hypothetical protein [Corallincola holothuriorum]RCU49138.1 hypothetical protein DU002_12325 [Corallincola holothuriorum]